MAAYEDFFPYILPEVPGANELIVTQAIRNSCIEFCEKSLALVVDHDPITIIQNLVDYDLDPPKGYVVVKVQQAWLENNKLNAVAPDFVRDASTYNRLFSSYESQASTPQYYLQKEPRSISVWPLPDKKYANGLTLRVAIKPTRASSEIDDVVFEDYAETIAHGALYRLMMSTGKPYSNAQMAAVEKGLFDVGVNVARSRALHGNVRGSLAVQMRRI